jgi:hypothetical protein
MRVVIGWFRSNRDSRIEVDELRSIMPPNETPLLFFSYFRGSPPTNKGTPRCVRAMTGYKALEEARKVIVLDAAALILGLTEVEDAIAVTSSKVLEEARD